MPHPQAPTRASAALPTADEATAHTLLNCLLREVCGPERQATVVDGHLLLRLPRSGVRLRVVLRRTSLLGAHRFTGPVSEQTPAGWAELGWRRFAEHVQRELTARTGVPNDEFWHQLVSSHDGITAALALRADGCPPGAGMPGAGTPGAPGDRLARYLESEQALLFGHRFHPTPKSRSADHAAWTAYAPESRAAFPLRHLAVAAHLLAAETARPGADAAVDRLPTARPVPDGYRLLPVHPWQYELLGGHPLLRAALRRGDVIDLGPGGPPFTPTASVRTLHGQGVFLKFSLNVRITNCLRKNASYELAGAVALTRLLDAPLGELAVGFPGAAVLREPAYRSLALPGADGHPDRALLEGFGLIVREDLGARLRPGLTALLAAAVADEYPVSPAHVSRLTGPEEPRAALRWWRRYLRLLIPPVLAAYADHGIVLEPHLQNVLIGVDDEGLPRQLLFRDLEGTKLLAERHAAALAALPADVAAALTYDARRGWDRVVYCLLVNNAAEMLAALADLYPHLEPALWAQVREVLREFGESHGHTPGLRALLAGAPLPAKANLLTRWQRRPDREAGYVRLPSPLAARAPDAQAPDARALTAWRAS